MPVDFDVSVDVSLDIDGVEVDTDDVALLVAVAEHGSLNGATQALGRSYAHAHRRLKALEAAVGPLTRRHRGGSSGGGTVLTARGRALVDAYEETSAAVTHAANRVDNRLRGMVRRVRGSFAIVETPPGPVRALAPGVSGRVTLRIPADSIAIEPHSPERPSTSSSAQNRLTATIDRFDRSEHETTVRLACRGVPLHAVVAPDSLDRLGLVVGDPVTAAFKATATRPVGPTTR